MTIENSVVAELYRGAKVGEKGIIVFHLYYAYMMSYFLRSCRRIYTQYYSGFLIFSDFGFVD